MSSFIDSGAGLVLSIWFVLVLVLNSESNFMIAKLTIWVWCGVVDELFMCFAYNVKQLNYVWLTAEITVYYKVH